MKILTEKATIHHGEFIDGNTFVDPQGNVYELHQSDFGTQNQQPTPPPPPTPPQKPPVGDPPPEDPPEKIKPDPKKEYVDVFSGYRYKWDGAKFIKVG